MTRSQLTVLVVMLASIPSVALGQTISATLDWKVADTTSSLIVEKSLSVFGPYTKLIELPANTSTYIDTTILAGQTVCYRVAHKSAGGTSPYAGPTCKTFVKTPPAELAVQ